jgi:hypothetical protein
MAAPDWVDGNQSTAVADDSLHAGITVDLLRGNILRAQEQSHCDLTGYHHDGDSGITIATGAATFQHVTNFGAMAIPMRTKLGTEGYRDITFFLDGTISVAGTATVRAFLLPRYRSDIAIDGTDGIAGVSSYTELQFTDHTGYQNKSGIITVGDVGSFGEFVSSDYLYRVPTAYLMLVCKVAGGAMTVTMRCPRVREVTT